MMRAQNICIEPNECERDNRFYFSSLFDPTDPMLIMGYTAVGLLANSMVRALENNVFGMTAFGLGAGISFGLSGYFGSREIRRGNNILHG